MTSSESAARRGAARLLDLGQSPWYDNLTRSLARGGLRALVADHGMRGVTSNPTIFEKAMASGDDYEDQLQALASAGSDVESAYWDLVCDDIEHAADSLLGVFDETRGADGYVSVEVSPELAHDAGATAAAARSLVARLARPNVMIKIPATAEGVPAIEECLADGINVNATLIFSLARYDEVIGAYQRAIERRVAAGHDPGAVASVASFFVSRVDTETDRRLPEGHSLRGRAAVANAKLAYRLFGERFTGDRWQALAKSGARVQRPLWASTSTKNPAYSPTLYVDELVGPDSVNTLAQASVDALCESASGLRGGTVLESLEEAEAVIAALGGAGVDFDDVLETLEREGVAAFAASFNDALGTLSVEMGRLRGTGPRF